MDLFDRLVDTDPIAFEQCLDLLPISVWVADFSAVKQRIDALRRQGVSNLERHLTQCPDETLACARAVRVLYVNKAALDLHGAASPKELLVSIPELLAGPVRDALIQQLVAFSSGTHAGHLKARFATLDGRIARCEFDMHLLDAYVHDWGRAIVVVDDREQRETSEQPDEPSRTEQGSQGQPHSLFDQDLLGVAFSGPDKRWLQVNQTLADMLGYTPEELTSMTWEEATHPEDLEANLLLFNRMASGKVDSYEMAKRFIRKDGSVIYTHLGVRARRKADGLLEGAVVVVHDISEQVRREQDLQQLVLELRERVKEQYCLYAITRLVADVSLTVSAFLDRVAELIPAAFQYPKQCLARIRFRGQVFGIDRFEEGYPQLHRELQPGASGVGDVTVAYTFRSEADPFLDEERMFLAAIASLACQGIAERELKARIDVSERKRRDVLDVISNHLWEVDRDRVLTFCSPNIESDLGYTPDEIVGKRSMEFMDREEAARIAGVVEETIANKATIRNLEVWLRAKDDRKVCLSVNAAPTLNEAGELIGYCGANQNITARKVAERRLEDLAAFNERIVEGAPVGVLIYRKDGTCVKANHKAAKLLGATIEQLMAQNFHEIPSWKQGVLYDTALDVLERRKRVSFTFETLTTFGRHLWLDMHVTTLQYADCDHLMLMFTDLTGENLARIELAESRERLALVLDTAGVGTWDWDIESNQIEIDSGMAHMLDVAEPGLYDRRELGRRIESFDVDAIRDHVVQAVRAADPFAFPVKVQWDDGSVHHLYTRGVINDTDGARNMIGVCVDITDTVQMQEAAREREALFKKLFDHAPYGIALLDAEGRIIQLNKLLLTMSQYRKQDLLGRLFVDFEVPEERQNGLERLHRLQSGAMKDYTVTQRIMRGDGTIRWCEIAVAGIRDDDQNLRNIVALARDITERIETRDKLAEASQRLQLFANVLEQSTEMVVITDETGSVQFVNAAFLGALGTPSGDIDRIEDRLGEPSTFKPVWDAITSGQAWSGRLVFKRDDGSTFTAETLWSALNDEEGHVTHFVGMIRDISDQLDLERRLLHAQKLEAVGRLAGGVAHDFNNILQAMRGFLDLGAAKLSSAGEARTVLAEVEKGVERATGLTRQLLAFSRRQIMDPKTLDLNGLITELSRMIRRIIGEDIRLVFRPDPDIGCVMADSGMMEQVIMNLCVNSRDAMPNGGLLTVETQGVEADEAFCNQHPWARRGRYIVVSLTDTGEGIPSEDIPHIFEPFFTTKELGKGTGLGLSTVYGILKQHDGMVHVYSELGIGTAFKIYLPEVAKAVSDGVRTQVAPVLGGTETILVAEDDESVLAVVHRFLEMAGYVVHTATNGAEAVSAYKRHADEIDLVMLDVVMPKMGGKEAHDRIVDISPDVCALFSSGYSANSLGQDLVLSDKVHLIQKPYHMNSLLKKVRQVLDDHPKGEKDPA